MVIFHKRSYESLFCFLSDRAYLVLKSPPHFFVRCWLVWDVLTPCAARMILLTSSSIPSSAMSNAGGREWARMGGILHGAVHGAWQIFRFQSPRKQNWSKVVVSLLDLKNMHLDLQNLDTFKKQTDVNFIDLDSELVDLNYKVASLIFCHFWRSIG